MTEEMDEKRWHERRYKKFHWVKNRAGRWNPETFKDNGESTLTMIATLMDAILESWTHCLLPPYGSGLFTPEDGQTDCNGFVNMVAQKMGYDGFKPDGARWPMRANEMRDKMFDAIEWQLVSGTSAQYYANHGYLVVAALKNPDSTQSGHVAVVRPGMMTTSNKWAIKIPGVPKVANVGNSDQCRLDRGSNWAFGKMPEYHVLLKERVGKV